MRQQYVLSKLYTSHWLVATSIRRLDRMEC